MKKINKLEKLAQQFEDKLKKYASFPTVETITPIIEAIVNSSRSSNKELLGAVKSVSNVSMTNNIDNLCSVYFQLIVDPNKYMYLIEEPQKSQTISILKEPIENTLRGKFPAFDFRVKIGIVPV